MDYHKKDVHLRMLKSIGLNIEILFNNKDYDICEYDIQAIMSKFLKSALLNTDNKVHRESFGKYDCAISNNKNEPVILYEIKTFLKPHEKLSNNNSLEEILKDFKKLAMPKMKTIGARRYFVLIFKEKEFKLIENDANFDWLSNRLISNRKEHKYIKDNYKLRPSSKYQISNICVYSWEVTNIDNLKNRRISK